MRFKILMPGWNCFPYLDRSLRSVAGQRDEAFDVCVVDDASPDPRQPEFVAEFCRQQGWLYVLNDRRRGALYNLYHAAQLLDPVPEDVIVFVDADDRLIHPHVLAQLRWYYEKYQPLITYGSYRCDPPDDNVTPALNFPDWVIDANAYRAFSARDDPDAIWFNHLRTMRFEIFNLLDPVSDFTFDDSQWFMACYDTAIMVPSFELAGGRHLMIPEALYLYTRDNPLSDCRVSTAEVEAAHKAIFARPPKAALGPIDPGRRLLGDHQMNDTERYLFDLNGYIILRGVLSPNELTALNGAVDAAGVPHLLENTSYVHTGFPELDESNTDESAGPVDVVNGLLTDWGSEFRNLVDHPTVLPYLEQMLGPQLRLDHSYAIFMRSGAGATSPHHLHNGGTPFDPSQCYLVRDGRMFNGLVVVSYALTDVGPGDGGLCVIPGSHKANFATPDEIGHIVDATPPVVHVPLKAGDVVIFTEAVTHGSIPWSGAYERRALLYKYAPGFIQWERQSPWASLDHPWTERQQRLLTGPYAGGRTTIRTDDSLPAGR